MINSVKARTPILALILFVFAIGYAVAAKVVVIPLGSDAAPALPSGMVSSFNSDACPTGWTEYINAQGRFIIGLNDGGTLGGASGMPYTNLGTQSHNHLWSLYGSTAKNWQSFTWDASFVEVTNWGDGVGNEGTGFYPISAFPDTPDTWYYTSNANVSPPYIQLLYCEKV